MNPPGLCTGDDRFTADKLGRLDIAQLIAVCRACPVLIDCGLERERWRRANPEVWAGFTGVWAGQAFTRGGPYKGAGFRPARTAVA